GRRKPRVHAVQLDGARGEKSADGVPGALPWSFGAGYAIDSQKREPRAAEPRPFENRRAAAIGRASAARRSGRTRSALAGPALPRAGARPTAAPGARPR